MLDSRLDADLDDLDDVDDQDGDDAFEALLREAAHVPAMAIPMPERGTLLRGRFEVLRRLGEGGMGVVYEVLDRSSGGKLALKTLSNLDAGNIQRLKHEFRSLSGVVHPNLVGFHELFSDGQHWFFTMDLVEGRDFLHFDGPSSPLGPPPGPLKDQARPAHPDHHPSMAPTPVWQRPHFRPALAQLVAGVQAIHAAGKLHRDLKPSNVLITDSGRVIILDFGLVADIADARGRMGERVGDPPILGTPAYMAPEQAARAPATAASDWYAVGVMLFQALTGRLPFEGTRNEVLGSKRLQAPPNLALTKTMPRDLAELCQALLQREPHLRPSGPEIVARLAARAYEPEASQRAAPSTPPSRPPAETFIGRRAELSQLQASFDRTLEAEPRVVLVHGSSGIGKSALVSRFVTRLRQRTDTLILSARCYEREAVPFKAFDGIIDELVVHLRGLSDQQCMALLPADVHALARVFPVLGRVAPVARAMRRQLAIEDPHELRGRAFAALRALLANLTRRSPLVLVIDDLQWSDVDSARMLEAIVAPPGAPALLVIGIYRREDAQASHFLQRVLHPATPEERYRRRIAAMFKLDPRLLQPHGEFIPMEINGPAHVDPDAERATLNALVPIDDIAVDRLDARDGAQLARSLLADAYLATDGLVERLSREADGIPFYIHELARHLRDQAQIQAGQKRVAPQPEHMISLHDAFAARLDALPAPARRLLEMIAVAGRPIRRDLALQAAELAPDDRRSFDLLRSLHLVRTRGPGPTDDAEVYHDRVRELVSGGLEAHRKRRRHAALARVLEASGIAQADWLAEQFYGAGLGEQAASYAVAAASQSRGALAFAAASDLYRWALSLVRSQYDAVVRRGTLRGTALGLFAGVLFAAGVLLVQEGASARDQLVILLSSAFAGAVVGMVAGSVVTLITTKDPTSHIDPGQSAPVPSQTPGKQHREVPPS